jgi:Tfp pilus assembly protein PilV
MLTAVRRRRVQARLGRLGPGQAGMTLTEVLVSVTLLVVVVVPILNFLSSTQRSEGVVSDSTRQQADARIAIESFSRSLREATYPQGATYVDSSIFDSAGDNSVTFYTDLDSDGVAEQVTYTLDVAASKVTRTVVVPDCSSTCSYVNGATTSSTMVDNVRNADLSACGQGQTGTTPLFTFYQVDRGTGTLTAIPSTQNVNNLVDISYVIMKVVLDITPNRAPTCQTLTTSVSLRNWRG